MRTPWMLVGDDLGARAVDEVVPLDGDREHHLRRVLRRSDGDPVVVTDGAGRVASGGLVPGGVRLDEEARSVPAPGPSITVHHAIPKGRALDDIVRTLAELGVAAVRPVITDHTESRPTGPKARSVGDRLRSVAESALQQAQSAHLCQVADPAPIDVTLRDTDPSAVLLAAHPAADVTLGACLATTSADAAIHLLIGPEGGLSDPELERLGEAGWTPVVAGSTVLRTVHAATVLTAAVQALSGRFG